jgi:hypothetical protein
MHAMSSVFLFEGIAIHIFLNGLLSPPSNTLVLSTLDSPIGDALTDHLRAVFELEGSFGCHRVLFCLPSFHLRLGIPLLLIVFRMKL